MGTLPCLRSLYHRLVHSFWTPWALCCVFLAWATGLSTVSECHEHFSVSFYPEPLAYPIESQCAPFIFAPEKSSLIKSSKSLFPVTGKQSDWLFTSHVIVCWKKMCVKALMKTRIILLYSANNCKRVGSKIRKLQAFKDSDCVRCQIGKNSWRQELLHYRTAGAERLKRVNLWQLWIISRGDLHFHVAVGLYRHTDKLKLKKKKKIFKQTNEQAKKKKKKKKKKRCADAD